MNHPPIQPGHNARSGDQSRRLHPVRPSRELIVKHLLGPFALGAAVMVVIIGCGGSPSTPSSASSEAAPSSSALTGPPSSAALPSSAATTSPPAAANASSPASPPSPLAVTSKHADPALEAQLPANVSGTALQHYSVTLSDALDAGGDRASIDAFLQTIGKSESDGSFGVAFDPSNTLNGGISAIKVSGADTATLLGAIVPVEQSDLGAGATTRQATVGGKDVTIVSVGTGPNDTEWIYGRGDVVFLVQGADEALAAAFLQALP